MAAIFSMVGWNYVSVRCGRLQRLTAAALVGVSILYGLLMIVREQTENLHAVLSPNFAQLRRTREIPYLASFDYLNSDPSVKKILILDRSVPPYYSQSLTSNLSASGANSPCLRFPAVSKRFRTPENSMLLMFWT